MTVATNAVFVAILATAQFVQAAEVHYPSKPVRLIVPATPGAGTDVIGRMLAQKLTEAWGIQVVVDNRPGAAGTLGSALAARAPADGHTLVMGAIGSHGAAQGLYKQLPYDPLRDFAPIVLVARASSGLLVNAALPAKSVKELIAVAKANPGKLNHGSGADGTPAHLASEMFLRMAGIQMLRVPYKGPAQTLTAISMGEVSMAIQGLLTAMPFVQGGRVRLIATTGSRRWAELPDVPTIAESLPGFEFYLWYGVLAPAGTPLNVVAKVNNELVRIAALADVKEMLRVQGGELATGPAHEFAAFLKHEVARWNKVVAQAALRLD
jgi:tripartite-type tricarboxylate transporter receptor subunit TctC